MEINKITESDKLIITVKGKLDTTTSPELENELENLNDAKEIVFDFKDLEYISSAGLRVLLKFYKKVEKSCTIKIINSSNLVKEIFDITGFSDILNMH